MYSADSRKNITLCKSEITLLGSTKGNHLLDKKYRQNVDERNISKHKKKVSPAGLLLEIPIEVFAFLSFTFIRGDAEGIHALTVLSATKTVV